MRRFYILDALRGVLALDVAIGHAGMFPLFGSIHQSNTLLALLARGWDTFVFGPPAVIAFFIISGFCIHYPFSDGDSSYAVWRFYARRYLRILIPVACVVAILKAKSPVGTTVFGENSIIWHSTLWSLVCEEIYYAAYPLLARLARTMGWARVIAISCLPMVVIMWWFFPSAEWNDVGIAGTSLTLLPVWLSGCYLAEHSRTLRDVYSSRQIWAWRGSAWLVMWLALVLHFHTNLHQTISGPLVGLAYYYWLRAEICYGRDRMPSKILVWTGQWSYSLYLIHPVVIDGWLTYGGPNPGSRIGWIALLLATLIASYAFYLAVEKPSHKLASRIRLADHAVTSSVVTTG